MLATNQQLTLIPMAAVMPPPMRESQQLRPRENIGERRIALLEGYLSQLNLPLFESAEPQPEPETQSFDAAIAVSMPEDWALMAREAKDETPVIWTAPSVVKLHSALLDASIAGLAGSGNAEEKLEILNWIFEPDIMAWQSAGHVVWHTPENQPLIASLRQAGWKPMYSRDRAFSFRMCCRVSGLRADMIHDFLEVALEKRGVKVFH